MNSASARASSVLPTPVGPRKRKVPIGRSGSCRPARERRSALATASTASCWPITRWWRRSSIWTSFSTSPSIRRETGIPVQRGDHLGDVLGVDLLLQELRRGLVGVVGALALLGLRELSLERGDLAVAQLGGALQVGVAGRLLELDLRLLDPLAHDRDGADRVLLALPLRGHPGRAAPAARRSRARSPRRRATRRRRSPSRAPAARSPAAGCGGRSRRSRSAWSRSRSAGGRPPRRSGRSPCRAGSGRRCSGARASRRR